MHNTKLKKPIWKAYIVYDSYCVTFYKRQNHGDNKKISDFQGLGDRKGRITGAQRIFRSVKILCIILKRWIHVIIDLLKSTKCTEPRVNPNVNYRLWVITICQCRFITCKKCTNSDGRVFIIRKSMYLILG